MTKRASFSSLLRIAIPRDDPGPKRFIVDLTPLEFSVIGFAAVQWAFLESVLFQRTRKLAKKARTALPPNARNLSFTRRLQGFREAARRAEASDPKQLAKYMRRRQMPRIARSQAPCSVRTKYFSVGPHSELRTQVRHLLRRGHHFMWVGYWDLLGISRARREGDLHTTSDPP